MRRLSLALSIAAAFAECGGRLYAAVGQQIYMRIDGKAPK